MTRYTSPAPDSIGSTGSTGSTARSNRGRWGTVATVFGWALIAVEVGYVAVSAVLLVVEKPAWYESVLMFLAIAGALPLIAAVVRAVLLVRRRRAAYTFMVVESVLAVATAVVLPFLQADLVPVSVGLVIVAVILGAVSLAARAEPDAPDLGPSGA